MRHTCLRWLAVNSLLMTALIVSAETRPRYGGTLRVSTSAAFTSIDPGEASDSVVRRNVTRLVFDTLVLTDDHGVSQPSLADSWSSSSGGQRWQFTLRQGVTFSDGLLLTADAAATSLRRTNPSW